MKRGRLSYLIPLLLILFALTSSALLFWQEIRTANRDIEQAGIDNLHTTLTHLQNVLNTQLAADNKEDAKLSLSVTALHPGIRVLLLADENNRVMMANRYLWEGSPAPQVSGYVDSIARQVRQTLASSVSFDASLLHGYYPVTLRLVAGGLGVDRVGVLFVEYDLAPQLARARHDAVVQAASFGGLMIAGAIAVAMLLHWLVSRRVKKIVEASKRFAAGDLDARVNLRGHDELAELGQAFDDMAGQRKRSEEAVIGLNRRLQSLLDAASEVSIIATDTQGVITLFNRGAEQMLGYSAAEMVGKETPMRIHLADEVEFRARELTAELGYPVSGFKTFSAKPEIAGTEQREWTYVRKDGTRIKVSLVVTTVRSEKGDVIGFLGIAQDITERKLAERKMLETSLYTRSLIEASLDPLVTISADGKITDVNQATEKVTGKSRSALIGTDFSDYFTEPDKARAGYQKVFLQGSVTDYPLALRHRDGHVTDVLYNASVYQDGVGNVLGVFAAARDITERKRAEAIRTQLAAIVESSSDAIIGKTTDGIITSWNTGAERIYGYTADEIIGKHITTLAPLSRHAEIQEILETVRNGGTVANHESERIRKDGAVIHVALTLSPIRDAAGHITGISTIARDITEKKHMEERLHQASVYNRSLIEASLDPLVTISAEGKITDVNQATEKVTGRSRPELIGTDFSDYFTEPDKAREGYQQVFAQGFVTDYPLALRHRDGHVTDVLYNASVYRGEAGEVLGVFAAARDVTERKKAEQEVAQLSSRNRLILDSMGEGIYGLDADGRCTFVNPAASQLLGFEVEELLGQHSHAMFHHTRPDGHPYPLEECPVQATYKQGLVHRGSDLYWRKDGRSFPVEFISTPVREAEKITGAVVAFRDITELKLAEEQLRRSEHGLSEAQRIAHLGNWELDLASNVLTWSDEIYRIFEIDKEKFGASYEAFLNAIHPDDREMVNKAYTDSVANKVPYDIVHRLQMSDGRIKYVNEKCETYYADDGKPLRSMGTVHDITERKLDEEALQRLNRELRAISNCNQTLMRAEDEQALLDDICRIVCEDAGYRMAWVGYPQDDEAKTIHVASRAGAEDGYLEEAKLTWADTERGHGPSGTAIRTGKSISIQDFVTDPMAAPWRDAALQRGYRSSISLPLKGESARVFGIFNIYAVMPDAFTSEEVRLLEELAGDMAFGIMVLRARIERERAQEGLRLMNERFALATRAGHLGVWDWNLQTNELVWDDRMYELYGVKKENFTGAYEAWLKGLHPDDRAYSEEISKQAQSGEREYDTEFRVVWPDGSIHYLKAYGQFVRDAAGAPVRMTGVNFDITELKEAENKVTELNHYLEARVAERTAQLEGANKELEAFAYSVSHDLRTPLRAIDGFSRILLDDYTDKLDDEGKRLLNVVRDNTTRMAQLIDDILKFSRTGRAEMSVAEIDMEKLARDVFAELHPVVDPDKLQLEIEHVPAARGDVALMRQVFVNLLSNAIKFSHNREPARIKVGCSVEGNEAVYYVRDNGAGFDMQYASRLFGVFQRLHAVTEFEGTGIGLAIVKRIIARHGGRVWAEGKVNEGATVYFALPRDGKEHA